MLYFTFWEKTILYLVCINPGIIILSLYTHFSVGTKKFILKRNFEKEHLEREAAEKACEEAKNMAQMESFNKAVPISKGDILVWEFQFLSIRNFLMTQMT